MTTVLFSETGGGVRADGSRRDWIAAGAEILAAHDIDRSNAVYEARFLTWHTADPATHRIGTSVPAMPGLAIRKAISELRLPRVSAIAWDGALEGPAGPDRPMLGFYGIEANYTNGQARVHVVDAGSVLAAVFVDLVPTAGPPSPPATCPKCGDPSALPGTVVWCHACGWADR